MKKTNSKLLFLVLAVVFVAMTNNVFAGGKKRALIIAVGDYPSGSGWGVISSASDIPLIKQSLLDNGFLNEDIEILIDKQATKEGIVSALEKLQSKITKGDIIVIHYSGHGQQIFDDNGDEVDGKDESIIPYDAFARYSDAYKGENHLRDDQIGNIIINFRNKLGKSGQLLVLFDSCHSGTMSRGGGKVRGGQATFAPEGWKGKTDDKNSEGSDMLEKAFVTSDTSPFVMISGASANELNYEYDGHGSLSYAFSKAMKDLGKDFTYRQLFSKILANMNVISPNQTPTIEGDMDYKLFKGEYVTQQTYFEISEITKPNLIQINAGKLSGLFTNTTVFILPEGTSKVSPDKILAKGTITNTNFNSATITLDKDLSNPNKKNYWVFIDTPSYGDIALKVFIDPKTVTDKIFKDGVSAFLSEKHFGEVVQKDQNSDVTISKDKNDYVLNSSKGVVPIDVVAPSRGTESVDLINQKLFNYAQGQYLKNLSLKNHAYEFEFKLLPIEYNAETKTSGALKPENSNINKSGVFEVNTTNSYVVLQVTNKSDKPIYFSIIEINSKGEINPFMPNNDCTLGNEERKLAPGKTMVFKDCVYSFGPPFERLVLKGFATSSPLNFQPTVVSRGATGRGFNDNPLEGFLQQSYSQSRGANGNNATDKVDGYTTEFVYEIVK